MVNADSLVDWPRPGPDARRYMEIALDAMSDDYVTVEIIVQTINEWDAGSRSECLGAAEAPFRFRVPRSIRALRELTREGYAQACMFEGKEAFVVRFDPSRLRDVWFYPTERGMEAVDQFPAWIDCRERE